MYNLLSLAPVAPASLNPCSAPGCGRCGRARRQVPAADAVLLRAQCLRASSRASRSGWAAAGRLDNDQRLLPAALDRLAGTALAGSGLTSK